MPAKEKGQENPNETPRQAALRRARAKRMTDRAKLPASRYDQREKIKVLMVLRGMNQSSLARVTEELAKAGEVPEPIIQTRISKWLLGVGEPGHIELYTLAKALKVPLAYLADPTRDEPPVPRDLQDEMDLESMVRRIGVRAALDRVSLRSTVDVYSRVPMEPERTYASEITHPRLGREKQG